MGGSVAEALAESGLVENVADLYDLSVQTLADLPMGETESGAVRRLGTANAAKIVANLEASKAQPLNRVITALGIRTTGRSVGRWAQPPELDVAASPHAARAPESPTR